jgi:hypothetical protein
MGLHAHDLMLLAVLGPNDLRQGDNKDPTFASLSLENA